MRESSTYCGSHQDLWEKWNRNFSPLRFHFLPIIFIFFSFRVLKLPIQQIAADCEFLFFQANKATPPLMSTNHHRGKLPSRAHCTAPLTFSSSAYHRHRRQGQWNEIFILFLFHFFLFTCRPATAIKNDDRKVAVFSSNSQMLFLSLKKDESEQPGAASANLMMRGECHALDLTFTHPVLA